jgi:hypothetical protein
MNVGKLLKTCPEVFVNEAIVSASSEYDINEKENFNSLKIE